MLSLLGFFLSLMYLCLVCFHWWNQICFLFLGIFILSFSVTSRSLLSSISFDFAQDSVSMPLVILSVWILALSILGSKAISVSSTNEKFLMNLLFLNLILILTFFCLNSLYFFFLFESTLIPTLYLILGWGYKVERVKSGLYMLFYTVVGSLPLMVFIVYHLMKYHTNYFDFLFFLQGSSLIYFFLMFGFMVKMPMFLVHSWLPKAHVEAPVSGSMILAGILLKLGGYGIIKFMTSVKLSISECSYVFICLALAGGVTSSFICLRQTDMKSLIAYSSISHMSLVIGGLLSQNVWGLQFSIMMMIGHGLCSSGLFYLTNINYERCHSRSIYLNKGLMSVLPNLSMWWFMFSACNMACPPSLNLVSEVGLFNSILAWSSWTMFSMFLVSFLAASYSLYLFSFTQHGMTYSMMSFLHSCFILEFLVLFLHWVPLNLLFLFSEFIF